MTKKKRKVIPRVPLVGFGANFNIESVKKLKANQLD